MSNIKENFKKLIASIKPTPGDNLNLNKGANSIELKRL